MVQINFGWDEDDITWEKPKDWWQQGTSSADYPIDHFPHIIQAAIEYVSLTTQAPDALVAQSALAAISIAAQGHAKVDRPIGNTPLSGPVSLYLLTLAESGERKSTVDNLFLKPIRDAQRTAREGMQPQIAQYKAEKKVWDNKLKQLENDKDGSPYQVNALMQHYLKEPAKPRIPNYIYEDITQEKLIANLADYPIGAICSSEGGTVLGAHSMGSDSFTRTMGSLNEFWDGGGASASRIGRGDIEVKETRFTFALQVQPGVWREFVNAKGRLTSESGWEARFLIAEPESKMGSRFISEQVPVPNHIQDGLREFHKRLQAILQRPPQVEPDGTIVQDSLRFDERAAEQWATFADGIEEELRVGGDWSGIKGFAAKAAEHCARLAALFHIMEKGFDFLVISPDTVRQASNVMVWYLQEAARLNRCNDLPEAYDHAEKVLEFLIRERRRTKKRVYSITARTLQQMGPLCIRTSKDKRDAALQVLEDYNHIKVIEVGRAKQVYVNPNSQYP